MLKKKSEFVLDRYVSGQTDMNQRLAGDPTAEQELVAQIIDPIVAVLKAGGDVGAVLTVAGHSDRVDTPGLSHSACLTQESAASESRTDSAILGIHQLVQQRLPEAPADLDTLPFFFVFPRWYGAGILRHSDPNLTEAQRQENRRVMIRLVTFT